MQRNKKKLKEINDFIIKNKIYPDHYCFELSKKKKQKNSWRKIEDGDLWNKLVEFKFNNLLNHLIKEEEQKQEQVQEKKEKKLQKICKKRKS